MPDTRRIQLGLKLPKCLQKLAGCLHLSATRNGPNRWPASYLVQIGWSDPGRPSLVLIFPRRSPLSGGGVRALGCRIPAACCPILATEASPAFPPEPETDSLVFGSAVKCRLGWGSSCLGIGKALRLRPVRCGVRRSAGRAAGRRRRVRAGLGRTPLRGDAARQWSG